MKTLDAVVPVYNEEAILPELNRRLADTLDGLPYEWRLIYVDDGSRDRTPELLAGFAADDPRVGVDSRHRGPVREVDVVAVGRMRLWPRPRRLG